MCEQVRTHVNARPLTHRLASHSRQKYEAAAFTWESLPASRTRPGADALAGEPCNMTHPSPHSGAPLFPRTPHSLLLIAMRFATTYRHRSWGRLHERDAHTASRQGVCSRPLAAASSRAHRLLHAPLLLCLRCPPQRRHIYAVAPPRSTVRDEKGAGEHQWGGRRRTMGSDGLIRHARSEMGDGFGPPEKRWTD